MKKNITYADVIKKPVTIAITAKCSDMFAATVRGGEGQTVGEYDGYVPEWFGRPEHFGDYVQLNIDLATGQIIGWKPPTPKQLKETFQLE